MFTTVMPTSRVTSSSWGAPAAGPAGRRRPALLLRQLLEPRPAQREVRGLGAREQGRAEEQDAEPDQLGTRRPSTAGAAIHGNARSRSAPPPARRRRPRRPRDRVVPSMWPMMVRAGAAVAGPGPLQPREPRGLAGQQQLVVLAAPVAQSTAVRARAPARRPAWRRRPAARSTSTAGAHPALPADVRADRWPRPSETVHHRVHARRPPPASGPRATRARGRRWAPLISASGPDRPRRAPGRGPISSTSRPAADGRGAGDRHRVARRGRVERSRGAPRAPSRVTLTIQPAGDAEVSPPTIVDAVGARRLHHARVERVHLLDAGARRDRPGPPAPSAAVPPIAAMSERFTARAFQPMSAGSAQRGRKWTSSISRSVVASRPSPAAGRAPRSRRRSRPGLPTTRLGRDAADRADQRFPSRLSPTARDATAMRGRAARPRKFASSALALHGEDRLGVELHALDRIAAVAQAHDLAVLGPAVISSSAGKAVRERPPASGSAWPRSGFGRPANTPAAVVADRRRLAVHLRGARGPPCRRRPGRSPGGRGTRPGSARRACEALGSAASETPASSGLPGPGEITIALGRQRRRRRRRSSASLRATSHGGAQLAQVLDEVVGERVVVVDDQDHRPAPGPRSAAPGSCRGPWSTSRATPSSGSESATMPAPTWIEARRPWQTTVRMVMHESRLPEYEM